MRPFVFACLACAATSAIPLFATAQDWLSKAIPAATRTHDFGTVARAAKTEHRFTLTNNSDKDIHLRSVRASCGCTTPIIETEWIRAGETGSVLARFNTGTFTGSKSATLTVSIDQPHFAELQLNVRGYIRSDIVLNPGEINFGEVPVGEAKSAEITLDYAGRSDWQLVDIQCPSEFVAVKFEEFSRSGGRVSYKIQADLADTAGIGNLQSQLALRTNDRNLTTVPIRILGSVQAPIQVSPQSFSLGNVEPNEPVAQRLVVKGKADFRILDLRAKKSNITYAKTDAQKSAHLLNISIVPTAQPSDGEVLDEIELVTDLIEEPIRIPLRYKQVTKNVAINVVAN